MYLLPPLLFTFEKYYTAHMFEIFYFFKLLNCRNLSHRFVEPVATILSVE